MVIRNLDSFNRGVKNFSSRLLPEQQVIFQKRVVFEVLRRVILRTPVDSGRARGGWQVTIGSAPESSPLSFDTDGNSAIENGVSALGELGPFQVVFVSNNVVYIQFLDEGSSSQAPKGIVSVALAQVRDILR